VGDIALANRLLESNPGTANCHPGAGRVRAS